MKHLWCHCCIKDCEFEALKHVWKLLFSHFLADQFCWLTRLNLIKNQQYQGQNYYSSMNTSFKILEFEVLALAYDVEEIIKIWRNLAKFAQRVTRGNSWRKWVVATSLHDISMHYFMTSKTSLMKWFWVPDLVGHRQTKLFGRTEWVQPNGLSTVIYTSHNNLRVR